VNMEPSNMDIIILVFFFVWNSVESCNAYIFTKGGLGGGAVECTDLKIIM